MLTRWTLENFKPIRERLDLSTAPLTVLAGLNSSGKSSFLQSIRLIAQTLANQDLDEPLALNGPLVRLGTFQDVCNGRAAEKRVRIGFTLTEPSPSDLGSVSVDVQVRAATREEAVPWLRTTQTALSSARLAVPPIRMDLSGARRSQQGELICDARVTMSDGGGDVERGQYIELPAHFLPTSFDRKMGLNAGEFSRVRRGARSVVDTFVRAVRYLGPLRDYPSAVEEFSPSGQPDDVGPRGEYAATVYSAFMSRPVRFWNPFSQQVETAPLEQAMHTWLHDLGVADHVSTRGSAAPGSLSWMVRARAGMPEYPLQSVGVGVSQILPILVSGLLAPEGTILIMEQPELHLHERPQARLGDFFYGLTRVGKQVFVETHSAVLINQLRYLMVKHGQEARDAIAVYFVQQDEQGDARFDPIRIGKGGAVENWPDGFFDESFRQEDRITQEGIRARGKRESA